MRRHEGVRYLDRRPPEWLDMRPVIKLVNEAENGALKPHTAIEEHTPFLSIRTIPFSAGFCS